MNPSPSPPSPLGEEHAWTLLLELAARAKAGAPLIETSAFALDSEVRCREVSMSQAQVVVGPRGFCEVPSRGSLTPAGRRLLDIYLPLCVGHHAAGLVIAHVGQSLDGQIATRTGASRGLTSTEDICHMHRLRALFDAVIVGARTVQLDDPQLTTRLVRGNHPTRVVIDPGSRLPAASRIFVDQQAPTVVIAQTGAAAPAAVPTVWIPKTNGRLSTSQIVAGLSSAGLKRLFVEGGGVTVSHFVEDESLDILQVTVCPALIGQGRPGLSLAGIDRIEQARRPRARHFSLGADVVFECYFDRQRAAPSNSTAAD